MKACAALYKDVGKTLKEPVVSNMRSHSWRTTLNNRAIAQGVSSDIRAAFFGHDQSVNRSAYTDLQDVGSMRRILAGEVKESLRKKGDDPVCLGMSINNYVQVNRE